MREVIKTIEEMKEVDFCMYCGSKLDKIEGKNVKICPKDCAKYTFVSIGDEVPKIVKEKLNLDPDFTNVDEELYDNIHQCGNGMIS